MNNAHRISKLATKLHWITAFVLFALPLTIFWQIMRVSLDVKTYAASFPDAVIAANVSTVQVWLCVALDMFVIGVVVYTLEQTRRLFAQFSRRYIFDFTTSDIITRIGVGLLVIVCGATVVYTLQVLVLTWTNPVGQRALSIMFDNSDVGFLLSAGLLLIIGWAMRDAAVLAAENSEFV